MVAALPRRARPGPSATSTSCASTRRAFAARREHLDRLCRDGAHAATPRSCRSRWAGAMSAPGTRCGRSAPRTPPAMSLIGDVMAEDARNCYLALGHRLGRRRSASRISSSSRPPTPCWSPRRDRAQDIKRIVARLEREGRSELTTASAGASPVGHLPLDPQRRPRPGEAHHGEAGRQAVAADAPPPRRALGRRARHRQGGARQRGDRSSTRISRPTSRSARRTGSRTPARSRCTSSRCSRAAISARTISSASTTPTAATERRSLRGGASRRGNLTDGHCEEREARRSNLHQASHFS